MKEAIEQKLEQAGHSSPKTGAINIKVETYSRIPKDLMKEVLMDPRYTKAVNQWIRDWKKKLSTIEKKSKGSDWNPLSAWGESQQKRSEFVKRHMDTIKKIENGVKRGNKKVIQMMNGVQVTVSMVVPGQIKGNRAWVFKPDVTGIFDKVMSEKSRVDYGWSDL
jgi:hypothetical protein